MNPRYLQDLEARKLQHFCFTVTVQHKQYGTVPIIEHLMKAVESVHDKASDYFEHGYVVNRAYHLHVEKMHHEVYVAQVFTYLDYGRHVDALLERIYDYLRGASPPGVTYLVTAIAILYAGSQDEYEKRTRMSPVMVIDSLDDTHRDKRMLIASFLDSIDDDVGYSSIGELGSDFDAWCDLQGGVLVSNMNEGEYFDVYRQDDDV